MAVLIFGIAAAFARVSFHKNTVESQYRTNLFATPIDLDEVRLRNLARSEAEIQGSKDAVLSGGESGLVGYWNLDEGNGQTAESVSGKIVVVR